MILSSLEGRRSEQNVQGRVTKKEPRNVAIKQNGADLCHVVELLVEHCHGILHCADFLFRQLLWGSSRTGAGARERAGDRAHAGGHGHEQVFKIVDTWAQELILEYHRVSSSIMEYQLCSRLVCVCVCVCARAPARNCAHSPTRVLTQTSISSKSSKLRPAGCGGGSYGNAWHANARDQFVVRGAGCRQSGRL